MRPRPKPWVVEACVEAGRRHTPVPFGYVERAEDAERRLIAGQVQALCPTCHQWAVWLLPSGERAPGSGP